MTKDKAYEEMCKEFDKGKREWSFDEIAEIAEKNMNVPKEKTKEVLKELGAKQNDE